MAPAPVAWALRVVICVNVVPKKSGVSPSVSRREHSGVQLKVSRSTPR